MADKKTCGEMYAPLGNYAAYKICGKPAKWFCRLNVYKQGYRCGIHAKRYGKVEKL
jgi:hypothetical protein